MAQIFPYWSNRLPFVMGVGLLLLLALSSLAVGYYFSPEFTDVGYRPHQPLPFSHRLHAGELKIDCRYCHATAEVSAVASVPPTQVCMNCHELVGGDAKKLALLRESAATGFPIQWIRVHQVPPYDFDHSMHLGAGIRCATCHGDVTRMEKINRSAEAMTVFAVICALIFPGIHTGRPWLGYWLLPFPNQMQLWPQFRSPLMWDVFAVSIYLTVSLIFWYVGLIPDFATLRDRTKDRRRQVIYGILALGWHGSQSQWRHYERTYLLLAGLATPLVLSVHSVVSFDFAVSQLPGWHSTIFPPYFVAGAIFSGLAMVVTLMVICRVAFKLENLVTLLHFERMARLILLTGSMMAYAYAVEFFTAWYTGDVFEQFVFLNRALGPYAWAFWTMMACNVFVPQVFWFRRARTSIPVLFVVSILVNVGMWLERFVIVVTSFHRDFMPSSWGHFTPTFWDVATLVGSFGLFFTLFCLFVRYLPIVAMSEVKGVLPEAHR